MVAACQSARAHPDKPFPHKRIRLNIVKSRAASLKHTGCWSKPVHNDQVVRKRIPRRWVVESLQLEPCLPHARSGRGALHVDDRRNKAAHLTTNFRRTETKAADNITNAQGQRCRPRICAKQPLQARQGSARNISPKQAAQVDIQDQVEW